MQGMMEIQWTKIVVLIALFIALVLCQVPVKKCVGRYELTFHKTMVTFDNAQRACQNLGGYLVTVNNQDITNAINAVMNAGEQYYIGLKWDGSSWRWRDGTGIGYQNWNAGEPNSGTEHCVVINHGNVKDIELTLKMSHDKMVINDRGTYRISCTAKSCSVPKVTWNKCADVVATSDSGTADLELQNVNISNAESYYCRANADGLQTTENIDVTVEGSPTILEVTPSSCTSNLKASWRPHRLALGFLHKVMAYPETNPSHQQVFKITPSSMDQNLNITNLRPTTKYILEIVACKTESNCPKEYTVKNNANTKGAPNAVRGVKFEYVGEACLLAWQQPAMVGDPITGYMVILTERIVSSRNFTTEISLFAKTTSTSHRFIPLPNRKYSSTVRSVACAGESVSIDATGHCLGLPQAPNALQEPLVSMDVRNNYTLTIKVPSETNGTMSCIFVIISNGSRIENRTENIPEYRFSDLMKMNASGGLHDGYIALAIPVSRIAFKREVVEVLGDSSSSSCNVYDTRANSGTNGIQTGESKWTNGTIFAKNKALLTNGPYSRVYFLTVVPNDEDLLLKRSPEAIFGMQNTEAMETITSQGLQPTTSKYLKQTRTPENNVTEERRDDWNSANQFQFDPLNFAIGFGAMMVIGLLGVLVWMLCRSDNNGARCGVDRMDQPEPRDDNIYEVARNGIELSEESHYADITRPTCSITNEDSTCMDRINASEKIEGNAYEKTGRKIERSNIEHRPKMRTAIDDSQYTVMSSGINEDSTYETAFDISSNLNL